jgi:uncharacterized membrane protein YeiH
MDVLIVWLQFLGVAVFAASGALTASRKELDPFGFVLVAAVTGTGGGTLRDVVLGRLPVFWIETPVYLGICAAIAILVFFTAHRIESRFRVLLWADALGLGLFAVQGTETALAAGARPIVAVLLGMITATFGGIIRDVLCAELPLMLRREIYATAAAAGALAYVLLAGAGIGRPIATVVAFAIGFGTRAVALRWNLSLPAYKARPGRSYPP